MICKQRNIIKQSIHFAMQLARLIFSSTKTTLLQCYKHLRFINYTPKLLQKKRVAIIGNHVNKIIIIISIQTIINNNEGDRSKEHYCNTCTKLKDLWRRLSYKKRFGFLLFKKYEFLHIVTSCAPQQ